MSAAPRTDPGGFFISAAGKLLIPSRPPATLWAQTNEIIQHWKHILLAENILFTDFHPHFAKGDQMIAQPDFVTPEQVRETTAERLL